MRNKMTRIPTLALLLTAAAVTPVSAQITNPAPYCAAGYDEGAMPVAHYISNVKIGTLNNSSGTTQYAAPHYVFYNNVQAPALVKGNTYPLSITHDNAVSTHFVAVYIDFNKNNSFADAGELVLQQYTQGITSPATANVIVPATAVAGVTRMRVMVFEDDRYTYGNTVHTSPTPCTDDAGGKFDWGETEDYNVNITAGGGTGIEDPGSQAALVCFPFPAKDRVYFNAACYGADVSLFDISGRRVTQYKNLTAAGIDISPVVNGLYFLRIEQAGKVLTRKIQVLH